MIYTEQRKVALLIRALRQEAPDWLVEHIRLHHSADFEGDRDKLLEYEQMQQENNAREAVMTKKHGRLLNLATRMDGLLEQELNEHNNLVERICSYANRVGRDFNRDKYWIAPDLFRTLKPESREDFLHVKKKLLSGKIF